MRLIPYIQKEHISVKELIIVCPIVSCTFVLIKQGAFDSRLTHCHNLVFTCKSVSLCKNELCVIIIKQYLWGLLKRRQHLAALWSRKGGERRGTLIETRDRADSPSTGSSLATRLSRFQMNLHML